MIASVQADEAASSRKGFEKESVMGYLEIRAPFRKLKVDGAEDLWDHFMAYRSHSQDTPIIEPKIFSTKTGIVKGTLDKVRPLTLHGVCNYIGMHQGTWDLWKKREIALANEDGSFSFFMDVMMQIENIIYDDQFQGAAVDIFNASIIQRKLGLADKTETKGLVSVHIQGKDAEL